MTAAAALLLAILIWASNSIMVKVILREIEPLTLTWLRFLLAALVYVPYAAATWRRAPGYTPREWALLVVAGMALVPAFSLTLYWALIYTTVANTALVRMTEPAWVLLLAALPLLGQNSNVYPVQEGFVDAHGVMIYYKTLGRGKPLVIVHGGPGASHDYFLPYLLPLARHNQLIFVDERGSGREGLELRQPVVLAP